MVAQAFVWACVRESDGLLLLQGIKSSSFDFKIKLTNGKSQVAPPAACLAALPSPAACSPPSARRGACVLCY